MGKIPRDEIKIHCGKYHCDLRPEACASRFLNSQGSGQSPVGKASIASSSYFYIDPKVTVS